MRVHFQCVFGRAVTALGMPATAADGETLGLPPPPTPQSAGRGRDGGGAAIGANVQGFVTATLNWAL